MNYYNEFDPAAAEWLRWLISEGHLPNGWVDERSIVDVEPSDLEGFTQCHFFAGIGGWSLAARIAGWPEDRPLWTGSCPCQPFSVAGKGKGVDDARHLWPDFFRLIRAARPPVVMGEQVAGAAGYGWFDGVSADLAGEGYACRAVDVPACAVDAPHIRSRLWWIACDLADTHSKGSLSAAHAGIYRQAQGERSRHEQSERRDGTLADAESIERGAGFCEGRAQQDGLEPANGNGVGNLGDSIGAGLQGQRGNVAGAGGRQDSYRPGAAPDDRNGTFWSGAGWITCHDGKARRAEPSISLLAHGIPGRVAAWRGFGNAIVPQVAAEIISAFLDTEII